MYRYNYESNEFKFKVLSNLTSGEYPEVTYDVTSNITEPINMFIYPEAPTQTIKWVSSNVNKTIMDIYMLVNLNNIGCGELNKIVSVG